MHDNVLYNIECQQQCGETETLICCWWECKLVQLLIKSKVEDITSTCVPVITLLGTDPRETFPCVAVTFTPSHTHTKMELT